MILIPIEHITGKESNTENTFCVVDPDLEPQFFKKTISILLHHKEAIEIVSELSKQIKLNENFIEDLLNSNDPEEREEGQTGPNDIICVLALHIGDCGRPIKDP